MTVFILGPEEDWHSAAVKWALEVAGVRVVLWPGLGWMEQRQASWNTDGAMVLGEQAVQSGDVAWIRRPRPPLIHPATVEADRQFAQNQYESFGQSLLAQMELLRIKSINPRRSGWFIENKIVQLSLAGKCRLNVPESLVSNSPQAVRSFCQRAGFRVVCKAFTPHAWEGTQSAAVAETFELKDLHEVSDAVLTYAPCIYQQMVEKQFDVRLMLFGVELYAYALHDRQGALDWRQASARGDIVISAVDIPPEVHSAVLMFAQQAGIVVGCFDFAVDHSGEWWFLEVNQQGQFLWLERLHPEARLLQRFAAFLTLPEDSAQSIDERLPQFPCYGDAMKSIHWKDAPADSSPEAKFSSRES